MTHAWLVLTGPDGRDVQAPSEAQMAAALAAVYSMNDSMNSASASADDEARSAVLRFGYADGLMYEVEVASGGAVRFAEWSDRDCEIALADPRMMSALPQSEALQLWRLLALRQVAQLRNQAWQ